MRRGSLCVGVLVLVLYMAGTVSAQMSDQAVAEFRSLGWQPATSLDLSASRSEITNLPGYSAVVGADAQRARKLEDADTEPAEAEVVNPTTGAEAVFLYIASGYVSSDDWGNLNPTALLDQIRQNSETANANRRSQGLPELHVIGWIQPPTLNPDTHTVFWSFSGSGSDGAKIINAVALKLGRYGFERITFIDEAVNIDTAPQNSTS